MSNETDISHALFGALFAACGGAVKYLSALIRSGDIVSNKRFAILLTANIFISSFCGLMGMLLVRTATDDLSWLGLAAGMFGYLGTQGLDIVILAVKDRADDSGLSRRSRATGLRSFRQREMILCPVQSPCRITQHYDGRPTFYKKYGLKSHGGLDLTGQLPKQKVPVYAPIEGRVTVAGKDGDYGLCVRLLSAPDFDGLQREVVLGHFSKITVKVGDLKRLGEPLGLMGESGEADGVHVHFAHRLLKDGKVLNANNGYNGFLPFGPTGHSEAYVLFWGDPASLVRYPYG